MMGCVEHFEEWIGVKLPTEFRVFDCRLSEEGLCDQPKTPGGRSLWGSERASYVVGLRTDDAWNDSTPIGCHAYEDFRTCKPERLAKAIADMVADGVKCLGKLYGNKPTALVAISNYGWSVVSPR